MTEIHDGSRKVIDAALELASSRPWKEVRLADIASEANMPMADLAGLVSSRSDILRLFARRVDRAMLESLSRDPVEGEAHDRLFEVLMRRFEVMAPYKAAITSIMRSTLASPGELPQVISLLGETQGWVLAAAGLEDTGMRDTLRRIGLASIYARVLRVWVDDNDPGLARTMAALDKALRDGNATLKRVEPALSLASAFASLARGLWRTPKAPSAGEAAAGNREAAE